MNSKLGLTILLAVLSLSPFYPSKSAHAAFSAADFCNSTRLKAIVEGIICKRDNCGDEGKLTNYAFACTQVDPADANLVGVDAVRIDIDQDTGPAAFTRVNDSYPTLDALNTVRLDPAPKLTEVPPCECLALIKAKTKCEIEQCPPPEKPPEVPSAPPPAQEEPAPPKAQVPDQATTGNNGQIALSGGSLCSLGFGDYSHHSMAWIGFWSLLNGLWLLGRLRASAHCQAAPQRIRSA